MKKILLSVVALAMACNASQKSVPQESVQSNPAKATSPITYASTISEEELRTHLFTYASDEFEGRRTGKPGQKKAVEYIRNYYQELGIAAAQKNGDYFQKVPLISNQAPGGSILFEGTTYPIGEEFVSFFAFEGGFDEIIYAGYGIDTDTYSSYEGLDVKNKLVLIRSGEPMDADGNYVLSGTKEASTWSEMSSIDKRMEAAYENGAKAFLIYDDTSYGRYRQYFRRIKNGGGQTTLDREVDFAIPIAISEQMYKTLLAGTSELKRGDRITKKIELKIEGSKDTIDTENVAAIIPGSSKPDEYIVISSHLDHIGINEDGEINNGADDDGSGTVAMLEIAEAFKEAVDAGNGPERSIVFLHVTGEEIGLLGSQYYTDIDPIFPLSQTVANLNIDMIGRIDPKREGDRNYIYLIGSDKLSTDLHELSERVNEQYAGLELDYTYNDENDPNRFYYRSDHYNFAKNNIPIIFYFNGTHNDYHRPGDTPDKINYDLLKNRSQLIFHTAWEIANRPARIVVDKASR